MGTSLLSRMSPRNGALALSLSRHVPRLIAFAWLAVLCACRAGTPPLSRAPVPPEVEAAAAEFRALRPIPGHFSGAEWNEDVDPWMGRKHRLMITLGDSLAGGDYDLTLLTELMGEPDRTLLPEDPLYERIAGANPDFDLDEPGTSVLVYGWRGGHDLLYFVVKGGAVVHSGWWYALE